MMTFNGITVVVFLLVLKVEYMKKAWNNNKK